ncbi:hypothetical protein NDU88_009624 [Pleurodeles waltl]|uniref:Uncharacterized protein n=1 Tax=Pleurodeles waltl TaxID=8319 RepID=A0AAV7RYX3_PLEWA|nr:hypothetical protein NDU88_009624 [Pleurodeles waltl]
MGVWAAEERGWLGGGEEDPEKLVASRPVAGSGSRRWAAVKVQAGAEGALPYLRLQRGTRLSAPGWFLTRGRGSAACRRPRACSPRSAQRLRRGHSPRVANVGLPPSPTPMPAPAAFGGPLVRLQSRRRVARCRAELGSQAAIMDRGQTTPPCLHFHP